MKNFVCFLSFVFTFACSRGQIFNIPEGIDKVEIPVELISNLMVVKAKVNGTALKFIVDSGAARTTIFNINEVDSLTVGNGKTTKIKGYGSLEAFNAIESENNVIQIEGLIAQNAQINVLSEEQISFVPVLGRELNGILGIDFFKNHLVALDYNKEMITVYRDKASLSLSKHQKFSLESNASKPYIKGFITDKGQQLDLNLLIDTGSGDALWLLDKPKRFKLPKKGFRDYLGFGMSGDIFGYRSKIENLIISDIIFDKVTFAYPEGDKKTALEKKFYRASIGGEILRRFNVVIDFDNKQLFLKKTRAFKNGFYYNMAGLKLREGKKELVTRVEINYDKTKSRDSRSLTKINYTDQETYFYTRVPQILVSYVVPDSPAENLGIKEGDQIIGVNNKQNGTFSMGEITGRFYRNPGSVLGLKIKRGEKIFNVKIVMVPIID